MTSELRFSRHAIDSTDEAMDMTFSLSEYTRHLLWRAVDEDTLPEGEDAKVLQKGDVA